MIHYFILLAYLLVVCAIPIKRNKVKLLLCFIPLTLFFGSRLEWTPDYFNYEDLFNTIHNNNILYYEGNIREIGFEMLCKILPSYRFLIWVVTILYTSSLFLLFDKYINQKYWVIAFIILFVNHQMLLGTISAMRSCIVASLFVFAIHLKLKNIKYLPYIFLIISFLFHRSSIVLLFILAFERFNHLLALRRLAILLIFTLITVSFFDSNFLGNKLIRILQSSDTFESYITYISLDKHSIFFYIKVLLNIFFIIVNIYLLNNSKKNSYWLMISIIFYTLSSLPNIGMTSRFTSYFGPAIIVGLSSWDEIEKKYTILKYCYIFLVITSTLYFFISDFPNYSGFYLYKNYNSIFFQQ